MPAKIRPKEALAKIHETLAGLRKNRQTLAERAEAHAQQAAADRQAVKQLDKEIADWEAVIESATR